MKSIVVGLAVSLALATAPAAKTPVKHDENGVGLYPVGTPGLTKEERRARNIYVVRKSIEGYQVAYKTKSFPKPPDAERQLERWAPGATMEMGKAPPMPVQHSEPEAGRDFGRN